MTKTVQILVTLKADESNLFSVAAVRRFAHLMTQNPNFAANFKRFRLKLVSAEVLPTQNDDTNTKIVTNPI